MKILYVATDQTVPGRTGGSIHVLEVARGLAALGHEVHAVVRRTAGAPSRQTEDGVTWHRLVWTPPFRFFRFRARPAVEAIAEEVRPDVVMERYYNFGGEGVATAHARRLPAVLEVNSPMVEHPGSLKAALDAVLLFRPMEQWRRRIARQATALVSPILEIVPPQVRARTEVVTWGANVDTFAPDRRSEAVRRELGIPEGGVGVVFGASFRPWHGVHVLEAAARRLAGREDLHFVLVGGLGGTADGFRGRRLGTVPYESMPEVVASCDIGVAPYDTSRLGQLRLGFYWSPLKIFEYMASGLPTVTIPRPPLTEIVRPEREGLHVREGDPGALADAIVRLADDAGLRRRLGASARQRVVERYSWERHCRQLEALLQRIS